MTKMRMVWPLWPLLVIMAFGAGLTSALLLPESVRAHAVLERSLPVQNERLQEAPALVEAWFSEPLERSLTRLRVLDTQGEPVHDGETLFDSEDALYAALALPPDLPPGIYTMTYENVSTVDGHIWSGFFSFIILNEDGTVPAGEALIPGGLAGQTGFLPANTDSALRWLGLLAAAVLGGGVFFAVVVARPAAAFLAGEKRDAVTQSIVAVTAAIASVAAAVVAVATAGQFLVFADRVGRLDDLGGIAFGIRSGELLLARIGLALALLLLFLPALRSEAFQRSRHATIAHGPAILGGLGLLITYSLAIHAATGGGQFWSITSDFVHFAATAAWLGALAQLPLAFWWARRRLEGAQRVLYLANVLDRFSWLSAISVVLIIGTGIFNGFVQLPTFESFYETTYGRVMIVKMAMILPLLAVAGFNALYLKPRLVDAIDALHDEDRQLRPKGQARSWLESRLQRFEWLLPRTAIAELLLGVAVLASVAVLSQSTTADGELRVEASRPSGEFVTAGDARDLDVELTITPFGIGINTFTVALQPKPGDELGEVLGVRLSASLDDPNAAPSAGRSSTNLELEATDVSGVWAAEAALMTQPGDWNLQARMRRRGLDDADAFFAVQDVGGYLARPDESDSLFALPFTFVDWNIVAGGAMVTMGLGVFLIWHHRPPNWRRSTAASVGLSSAMSMIAGVVLLFGVHGHENVIPNQSPILATAESLARGQETFVTNCTACHGTTGEGDGPGAAALQVPPPRLGDHVPFHNDGTIFLWISEGIPLNEETKNMPAFKEILTVDERWHLVNFLRATFKVGDFVPVLPEDLAQSDAER